MQLGVLSSDCCLWAKLKTLNFFNLYLYKQLEYLQYVPILEFVAIILCLFQSIYQMIHGFFYQLLDLYSEFYFLHHISQNRIKFFCFSVIKHKNNSSIYICYTILGISRNFYWGVFSSVAQSCPTLCDPMNCRTPGLPAHHQLPEFTQTHAIKSVMPSSHLILCCHLLLLPPIPPSIRVFSDESTLRMRWPKYWSFSFSIIPSKKHPGLIFKMDWLALLAV